MRRIRKWLNTELETLAASKMAIMLGPQVALAIPLTARHSLFPSLGLPARARDAAYRKFSRHLLNEEYQEA